MGPPTGTNYHRTCPCELRQVGCHLACRRRSALVLTTLGCLVLSVLLFPLQSTGDDSRFPTSDTGATRRLPTTGESEWGGFCFSSHSSPAHLLRQPFTATSRAPESMI